MELSLKERNRVVRALEDEAKKLGGIVHTFSNSEEYVEHYLSAMADLKETRDLIKKFEEVPF
ncbi:hypothetical protein [Paenibacillus apis]|uniref:Uncharacterized protein n=1 Tax=Paenibacillus apis TaxID=1792174 RepID=A0A919Y0R8_9BACL|nr:hypothetical protein [Paenibacillus apis]GIO42527.1 hypothetical protein J41TS4_22850 [Paenibacillus apis]